jgi:hypothetical protein
MILVIPAGLVLFLPEAQLPVRRNEADDTVATWRDREHVFFRLFPPRRAVGQAIGASARRATLFFHLGLHPGDQ